jgi:hypothetical protein
MPDLPISSLPSLTTPEPADVFAIVNNAITKKTTVQAVGNSVFNQISSSVILPSQTGSFGVTNYYGSFYHTASMINLVPDTPNTMSLSTTDISNGVIISGSIGDKIKFTHAGVYNIQFSAQLDKTSAGSDFITYIWIKQNNSNIPISNTAVTVLGGSNAKTVAAWNWFVNANAGDYVQLIWASSNADARVQYDANPAYGPAVPSLIVTANRVG